MSGGGFRVLVLPGNVRKMIHNIKEIAGNRGEEGIYAMLKEFGMDPNETAQNLLLRGFLDGYNYKRWSQKLLLFFEQLEIDYILFTEPPPAVVILGAPVAGPMDKSKSQESDDGATKKFEKDNKSVRYHMLQHMNNSIFDLYANQKSAKAIWDALLKKYGADEAGKKKYVVGRWLQFKIDGDKPIMDQVHEYENLTEVVLNEGMEMCEILQANVLWEKLPPCWSDYRNHLKHKKKDITLQELISHMRIEEAKRRFKDKDEKAQTQGLVRKQHCMSKVDNRIQKPKLQCYVCGKPGHKAYLCSHCQGQQKLRQKTGGCAPQSNLVEKEEIIAEVVVEANLSPNNTDWVLVMGATRHLCINRELFSEFEEDADGDCVHMGNSAAAGVFGKGKILLKLTYGKTLALNNVLYVPSLCRNIVSGALLNKAGMKIVLDGDKVVITRNGDFVGDGYLNGGLFVLDVASGIMNGNPSGCA